MTKEAPPADWFYREGGVVTSTSWDVADPSGLHLHNAYTKLWRGKDFTAEEQAALDASNPARPMEGVNANLMGDVVLGAIMHHRRHLLETFDKMAADLAAVLPGGEMVAWGALANYARSALQVTTGEMIPGHDQLFGHLDGEEREAAEAAYSADWEAQVAASEAWETSPEGQAVAAAMVPDDGPEGWSQVPPANSDHPNHPNKRPAR